MSFRFGIPITKTKKLENGGLEVEGVFSSDVLDKTRDVVTIEATKIAWDRWEAKNLREQHDPKKAVGKALEVEYFEEGGVAKALLRGFITPGAPDTIQKVEDKTLGYFSIGAMVNATEAFKAGDGKPARRITDYDLVEISLVDNPANPDAKLKYAMAPVDGLLEALESAATAAPEAETRFGKALKAAVKDAPVAPVEPGPVAKAEPPAPAPVEPPAPAAPAPVAVQKYGEEWDITAALDILLGLKGLLFCETLEPEQEPPAQRKFLETAIEALQNFIASEAGELAGADPGAAAASEMSARPSLLKTLARAFAARDAAMAARIDSLEKTIAAIPAPFTALEGEQLGAVMGEVLTFTKNFKPASPDIDRVVTEKTEQIGKALGDLKARFEDFLEGEVKAMRADLTVIKAMPVPGGPIVRRTPGMQTRSAAPAFSSDPEIQVLEKRLANTSDPAARAVYERDLRFARAKKGLNP